MHSCNSPFSIPNGHLIDYGVVLARRSERIAQPQLYNPRVASARDSSEQVIGKACIRIAEVDAVERIEELCSKLKFMAFRKRHRERFEERQICVCESRSA